MRKSLEVTMEDGTIVTVNEITPLQVELFEKANNADGALENMNLRGMLIGDPMARLEILCANTSLGDACKELGAGAYQKLWSAMEEVNASFLEGVDDATMRLVERLQTMGEKAQQVVKPKKNPASKGKKSSRQ